VDDDPTGTPKPVEFDGKPCCMFRQNRFTAAALSCI
jgi:hypothetical protein